jgi:hypothetical protein
MRSPPLCMSHCACRLPCHTPSRSRPSPLCVPRDQTLVSASSVRVLPSRAPLNSPRTHLLCVRRVPSCSCPPPRYALRCARSRPPSLCCVLPLASPHARLLYVLLLRTPIASTHAQPLVPTSFVCVVPCVPSCSRPSPLCVPRCVLPHTLPHAHPLSSSHTCRRCRLD